MSKFHLFREPGEPGYIEGAMTSAGSIQLADTGAPGWNAAIDDAHCAAAEAMGLTMLVSGKLIAPCGLLLDEDYLDQIEQAGNEASEVYCAAQAAIPPSRYDSEFRIVGLTRRDPEAWSWRIVWANGEAEDCHTNHVGDGLWFGDRQVSGTGQFTLRRCTVNAARKRIRREFTPA